MNTPGPACRRWRAMATWSAQWCSPPTAAASCPGLGTRRSRSGMRTPGPACESSSSALLEIFFPLTPLTHLFTLALILLPFATHQHLPLQLRLKCPRRNSNHLVQVNCRNPPNIRVTVSVPMDSGSRGVHRTCSGCLLPIAQAARL